MKKNEIIILGIVLAFSVLTVVLYSSFFPDDTFIHIGFAKDIAEGKGYSFTGNVTFGSSSPLWPLLIALTNSVVGNFERTMHYLSLAFGIVALLLFYKFLKHRFEEKKALLGTALLAFNPYMLRWAGTGMETTAAVFWMVVFLYVAERETKEKLHLLWYVLAGCAPLIRFELYAVLLLFLLTSLIRQRCMEWNTLLLLLPAVLWNAYALWHFGTIVPTTYLAKANDPFFAVETDILLRTLKLIITLTPVELLCIAGGCALWLWSRRDDKHLEWYRAPKNIFAAATVLIFYGYYIVKNVKILSRYALFTVPVIILFALECLDVFEKKISKKQLLSGIVLAAACFYSFFFTAFVVYPTTKEITEGFQKEYRYIAELLRQQSGEYKTVATSEVGIIGVYSGCRVYDFNGLVDHTRFSYSTKEEYFRAKKPRFLISKGEIDLSQIDTQKVHFRPLYTTSLTTMGINEKTPFHVTVYEVEWNE